SSGKISGESILAYPPGGPIIAPGELITNEVIRTLKQLIKSGAFLTDQTDKNLDHILVIK
ncbi:arginine decarboxylase, partial [Turicibacter sanguinis]|nr:arginine decarboxylase [Turicibacter sanguinis]